jgi:UTP--glucose-1-phosphate uridylyltransferase
MEWEWDAIEREFRQALGEIEGLALDRERLEGFADALARGVLGPEQNRVDGDPEPADREHVDQLEGFAAEERARYRETGEAALARGEVACCVLNGGMATRFGGAVKGIIEALDGRSFLELKLRQAQSSGPAPFVVMNSFATHRATGDFLASRGLTGEVHPFLQSVSLRLTPEGGLFRGDDGALSLYAPGHGDFPDAIRRSGTLDWLEERGVRTLMLSNVDNLGAGLDPVVVGYHLAHGKPLTSEVARALPGDVGGAPAFVAGRLQVVEGFRFPADFDFARLVFLNTNTFLMSLALLREEHSLTWFFVEKTVDGRRAVQMERLVNELSSRVDTAYLATPRDGPEGRFFPTKTRADLAALRRNRGLARRFREIS